MRGGTRIKRPINVIDLEGKVIGRYESMHEASRETGIEESVISDICRGISKCPYGHHNWRGITFKFATIQDPTLRRVVKCDFDGNILESYECIDDAATKNGLSYASVRNLCIGKVPDYTNGCFKGRPYTFRYEDDPEPFKLRTSTRAGTYPVAQIDRNGKTVAIFENVSQASEITGITSTRIRQRCRGETKKEYIGEYTYKFLKELL